MSALNSNNTFDGLDEPVRPTPLAFLVRAPASHTGNPCSRPARCDGADPGGLHQHKAGATGL